MTVSVKLFGPQAQLAGRREITVDLDAATANCAGLREALIKADRRLAGSLPSSRFAINHQFVDDAQPVRPDDEIALIGMISGG